MAGRHSAQRSPSHTSALLGTAARATAARSRRLRRHLRPGLLGPVATAAVVAGVLAGSAYGVAHTADTEQTAGASTSPGLATGTSLPSTSPLASEPVPGQDRAPREVSRGNPRPAAPSPSRGTSVVSTGTCGASYYDEPQGTANGETFDPDELTAAHKTLKFGTRVRVTNLRNGRSVTVRINDRGPYVDGRCLDLSRAAFGSIESLGAGIADVRYEVLA